VATSHVHPRTIGTTGRSAGTIESALGESALGKRAVTGFVQPGGLRISAMQSESRATNGRGVESFFSVPAAFPQASRPGAERRLYFFISAAEPTQTSAAFAPQDCAQRLRNEVRETPPGVEPERLEKSSTPTVLSQRWLASAGRSLGIQIYEKNEKDFLRILSGTICSVVSFPFAFHGWPCAQSAPGCDERLTIESHGRQFVSKPPILAKLACLVPVGFKCNDGSVVCQNCIDQFLGPRFHCTGPRHDLPRSSPICSRPEATLNTPSRRPRRGLVER